LPFTLAVKFLLSEFVEHGDHAGHGPRDTGGQLSVKAYLGKDVPSPVKIYIPMNIGGCICLSREILHLFLIEKRGPVMSLVMEGGTALGAGEFQWGSDVVGFSGGIPG